MLKKSVRLALVGVLAAAGMFTVATPAAQAATRGYADCNQAGQVCMWEDGGAQGDNWVTRSGAKTGKWEIPAWNGDNEISSVLNATKYCLTLYANDGWTGRTLTLRPHTYLGNMKTGYNFNDDAESYKLYSC